MAMAASGDFVNSGVGGDSSPEAVSMTSAVQWRLARFDCNLSDFETGLT